MTRSCLQGLRNIIVFNWPYYAVALVLVAGLLLSSALAPSPWSKFLLAATVLVALPTLTSILTSTWIYDFSGLYRLRWLEDDNLPRVKAVLVLNAGFDEISDEIRALHPDADLLVVDFHDPVTTTEPSIERARRVQTGSDDVLAVKATDLPIADRSTDLAVAFMSAHEIRTTDLRVALFREVARGLAPHGRVFVVEHLRDLANFLAYSVGFRHFHSQKEWQRTFAGAGLAVRREFPHTPFVRVFVLGLEETEQCSSNFNCG